MQVIVFYGERSAILPCERYARFLTNPIKQIRVKIAPMIRNGKYTTPISDNYQGLQEVKSSLICHPEGHSETQSP